MDFRVLEKFENGQCIVHAKRWWPYSHEQVKDLKSTVLDQFPEIFGIRYPVFIFNGSRAMLSGPAGGVMAYAKTTYNNKVVMGLDMDGTSTDVSRYDGSYEHVFELVTVGITLQDPQLYVNTVATGRGSRLFFRSELFVERQESALAHPGPVCCGRSGYFTVTDAKLVLRRLLPEFLSHIWYLANPKKNL